MDRICIKCGHKEDSNFCKICGTSMNALLIEANGEIFAATPGINIHAGCGGYIDTRNTTKGNKVHCCQACFLRIEQSEYLDDKN